MRRLLVLFSFVGLLFSSFAFAGGDVNAQKELDELTRRLIASHLEGEVDEEAIGRFMESMQSDGSFPKIDYVTVFAGFPAGTHLKRLKAMAHAYRKPGNKYYNSKKLLNKIQLGFEYWNRMQPKSKNWWFIDIGAPQDYMVALILLKDKISEKKLLQYSAYLEDRTGNQGHKGKNRTWVSDVTIHKGCIENNMELVRIGFESIASTIKIVPRQGDEGIKIDGSFHQHRPQLYSGGYGLSFMDDLVYYIHLVNGTAFAAYFTPEKRQILSDVLLNGQRLLGYRSTFEFGATGRNITRRGGVNNVSATMLSRMIQNDPEHAAEYQAWLEHLGGAPFPVPGNKYFWKSDIMTQHGANYYLSAKVLSTRTNGTEMLNNENMKGYNLPLGATNILTSGEEYKNIFPLWNWTRIPGTTAVQHPDSARLTGYFYGTNVFAGGVSSGRNGLIAYEHDYRGLQAKKAYFFLDDVLLCLGAGITSDSPEEVATTVNQCYFSGELTVGTAAGPASYKKDAWVENPLWVYHDRVGYLFPMGGNGCVSSKTQTGSWRDINIDGDKRVLSADIFNLWINHGKKAMDATYAYMVVPDQSLPDFENFVTAHTYKIIKNTADIQAVKLEKAQAYGIVFYTPGTVDMGDGLTVGADKKSIVYIEKVGDGFKIRAADPLHSQKEVHIILNGREVTIPFPDGATTGSTATVDIAWVEPADLQCEYLKNPLGLDVPRPRLSWKMGTTLTTRGQKQTAYQVLVASSRALLDKNEGDLWDSGRMDSGESVNIVYDGKPLATGQKCFWKVRLVDEQGNWTSWSEPATWQMGLFADDWKARWIGSAEMESQSVGGRPIDNKMPDPWFRKRFTLTEAPQEALIYVASIGYHELYVNGERIGDAVLSPSVTDHKSRARYMTYDITRSLKTGDNVIALWLGTSWAIFPAYQQEGRPAIPMALAQAEITLPSGEKLRVLTDDSWKTHASSNTLMGYWDAHHFAGEFQDASLEIKGWNETGFDDSAWAGVKVYQPQIVVSADKTQPNRLMEEIRPLSVKEVKPGVYRVDMGINYAGWFEMQLAGQPGDSIVFRFSEREKDVCSFGIHSIYKVGPGGKGTFCNRFNYMTGRWVQITGLRSAPKLEQIRGWMIRPDYRQASGFECDMPLLNDLYRTTLWTFENLSLGNFVVDCPHRERRGYGGDALATTRAGLDNYQLAAFYTKWMEDWRDVQGEDGSVPHTAPTYIGGGGPSWSGFCITLPWEMYRQYGDVRILTESFSTIQRWLNFVETKSKDNMLVRWGSKWSFLGDWLWPDAWPERSAMEKQGKALGDTRETLFFNNCHWIYSLETAARIADVLGNEAAATAWRKRAAEVRKAVHTTFFNSRDNSYVNGYPSYLAIALMVDLPPKNLKAKVWKRLEQEIRINRKGHFWGGITAGSFLFHTLLDNHRNDLICEMVTKEDFPGWGNMLKKGNGTFFEDWECRGSALHSSYLYIGTWFIEALGGIQRPEAGFREFVIAPWINEKGPKKVHSHYNSMYGTIVSNWEVRDGKLDIEVVIPANTTALLKLPNVRLASVKEGGIGWKEAKGVRLESQQKDTVTFTLEAGTYHFSAMMCFPHGEVRQAMIE